VAHDIRTVTAVICLENKNKNKNENVQESKRELDCSLLERMTTQDYIGQDLTLSFEIYGMRWLK
jgi:hypothetical protein